MIASSEPLLLKAFEEVIVILFPDPSRYLFSNYVMEIPAVKEMGSILPPLGVRLSLPMIVGWLVTTDCQLRCRHCWVDRTQPQATHRQRKTVARRLAEQEICRVSLSGGEVTLLPELGEYVRILKEADTPISIYTNAMDPIGHARGIRWLECWDHKIDYVQISLDGGNKRDFEAQRGQGTFSPFLKGVELLVKNNVRLLAHYIATSYNRGDVYSAARLALELGSEAFVAEMFYPKGRAASIPFSEAIATAFRFNASVEEMLVDTELISSPMELGICPPVIVPFPKFIPEDLRQKKVNLLQPVKNGTAYCFVMPSGEVYPSAFVSDNPSYSCGFLTKENLLDIWNNGTGFEKMPRIRDLSNTPCAACPDFGFCQGGLDKRAYLRFKTYNAHDPDCHFCRES